MNDQIIPRRPRSAHTWDGAAAGTPVAVLFFTHTRRRVAMSEAQTRVMGVSRVDPQIIPRQQHPSRHVTKHKKKDLDITPGLCYPLFSNHYDQSNINPSSVTFRANTFPLSQKLCHIIVYCDFQFRRFFLKCTHESIINIQIVIIMRAKQIKRGFVHRCL